MQEHGVLERILLVYEEAAARADRGAPLDTTALAGAAGIVRRFVEEYHERLEEDFVFPKLETARREAELVGVLRRQHARGREVTGEILQRVQTGRTSVELARALRGFSRMYRPHAAREDTVLFPAFRSVIGGAAYRELGERFEEEEHRRFGEQGFEGVVREIAQIEAAFGVGDLTGFAAP